jgi:predicted ATP-grasp superfamily ATP-dependent carboligase
MLERDLLACQGSNGLFASRSHVEIMSNKKMWVSFLTRVNLSHYQPQYWTRLESVAYPVFLKRLDLNAGQCIVRVPDRESLEAARNTDVFKNHDFLIQEAVDTGDDWVTHILASKGDILWSETFRYLEPPRLGNPFAGRGRPLIREHLAPQEFKAFQEIIKALSYSGITSLDWRMGTAGPKILEANPRMGGSLMRPENTDILASLLRAILTATRATR